MINIQMLEWNKSPSQLAITQFLIVDFQTVGIFSHFSCFSGMEK